MGDAHRARGQRPGQAAARARRVHAGGLPDEMDDTQEGARVDRLPHQREEQSLPPERPEQQGQGEVARCGSVRAWCGTAVWTEQ